MNARNDQEAPTTEIDSVLRNSPVDPSTFALNIDAGARLVPVSMRWREAAALTLAAQHHANHRYGSRDEHSYMVHLAHVRQCVGAACDVLGLGSETLPTGAAVVRTNLFCAAWLHDVMEDSNLSYNDIAVKHKMNGSVAEYVYCVSGFGRNRKERFECMREKVIRNHGALLLKACDRISNYYFASALDRTHTVGALNMKKMYKNEMSEFMQLFADAHDFATDAETRFERDVLWSHRTISVIEAWFNGMICAIDSLAPADILADLNI